MNYEIGDYVEFKFNSFMNKEGMISESFENLNSIYKHYTITERSFSKLGYNFTKEQENNYIYLVEVNKQSTKKYSYFVPENTIISKIESIDLESLF